MIVMGFPGGTSGKGSTWKCRRCKRLRFKSPRGGNGKLLQNFCLKNSMDRGAWWATVYGVTKSRTRLSMHTGTWPLLKFLNAKRREISVGEKPEMLYRES